jgi:hypothetical protein
MTGPRTSSVQVSIPSAMVGRTLPYPNFVDLQKQLKVLDDKVSSTRSAVP